MERNVAGFHFNVTLSNFFSLIFEMCFIFMQKIKQRKKIHTDMQNHRQKYSISINKYINKYIFLK